MICKNCYIETIISYSHPTLGAVCPVCLNPKSKTKKKKTVPNHPYPGENKGKPFIHYDGFSPKFNPNKPDKSKWKRSVEIEGLEKFYRITGCRVCGETENITVDHIRPKSKGGQNTKPNKQPLCEKCNKIKGNQMPGKNRWWPDTLLKYLVSKGNSKVIWNADKLRWEDG